MKKVTIINTVLLTGVMLYGSLQIQAAAQDDNNQKRIVGATAQQNAAATLIQAGIRGALERRAVQQGIVVQPAEIQEQLMPQIELVPQAESAQCVVLMPQPELMNEGERSLAMPLVQSDDSSEDSQPGEGSEAINQLLQQNNNDLQAALFDAVRNNRIWALKGLMQRGVRINIVDQEDFTPLMIAARAGHLEMVRMLIVANADVNRAGQNGVTPLMVAGYAGHIEIVQMLIAANADVNRADQNGGSPLILATDAGHVEIVRMLIVANADANRAGQNGITPLMIAVLVGHVEIMRMLIGANADVNRADQNGVTPLMGAAQAANIQIVQMLLQANADINVVNQYGASALMVAAYVGHEEMVRMLIAYGAKINVVNRVGSTPLVVASSLGHGKVVQILLEAKADVNIADQNNIRALESAVARGDVEIARMLIAYGANVNAVDQNGDTLLMKEVYENNIDLVLTLISFGANVNVVCQNGFTPLIAAISGGNFIIARMLMAAKADVNFSIQGVTALLMAAGAGAVEAVQKLIDYGANVDLANLLGTTPLMRAAESGHNEVVQILLEARADINIVDPAGITALMVSAASHQAEVVRTLLAAKANVSVTDQNGNTALILMAAQDGAIDAVRMLIDAGASIEVFNKNGISALVATPDFEVAQLLTDSYRAQLAQRHHEKLIEFLARDFEQFNRDATLQSMGKVLYEVGETITGNMADNDRRNLVNTGCGACIKAAVNGRNGRAHEIKTKLFSAFITSALQKLVSAKEEFAGNEQVINNIEKYLPLLNQELTQGYYVREHEQQNIESQAQAAHAAASCVIAQQDGSAVAGVDEQAGSVAAQDRQVLAVEDRYAAERVLRAEQNNEYEESVRIDQRRDELERRIAQLMEQVQPFLVEQNSDVASPIVDAVSFEAFQKARDLFAELIVVRAELIDIAKKSLMLDPTYAEHKAARIAQQEQVLAHEHAQLQMTESALDDFMSAPTHEEIREQRIKMLGGQAVDRKGKNPAR